MRKSAEQLGELLQIPLVWLPAINLMIVPLKLKRAASRYLDKLLLSSKLK